MGGKAKTPRIDVPDPREIMEAEARYNRVGTRNPFGSVRWEGNTQVTELSPQMQAMTDRMFDLNSRDSQRFELPEFLSTIAGGIMGRVGDRYGVSKPEQPGAMPPPQFTQPTGPAQIGTPPINPNAPPSSFEEQMRQLGPLLDNQLGVRDMQRVNRQFNGPAGVGSDHFPRWSMK